MDLADRSPTRSSSPSSADSGRFPARSSPRCSSALTKALCIALGDVDVGGVTFAFPKLTLVAEFVVMAIVLAVKPQGLLGKPPRRCRRRRRCPSSASWSSRPDARDALVAAALLVRADRAAGRARRIRGRARHRHPDRRAVRGEPAVPARHRRHDVVRPRRVLRRRRVCGGARRQGRRGRCPSRSRCAPIGGAAWPRSSSAGSACACPASTSRC